MTVLTEEMVVARTKQSNLASITKFNCWGSQLSDVSILRQMPNVTVLSLSVNSISTLADFQYCKKLQDLYVRKNNIKDLNEICYLQDLQCLRSLWIDENPCADNIDGYRLAVLRTLPRLSKLDDRVVEPSEVEEARQYGRVLVHPDQQQEYYSDPDEDDYEPNYTNHYKEQVVNSAEQMQYIEPERETSPEQYQRQREYVQNSATYETDEEVYIEVPKQAETPPESRVQICKEEGLENYVQTTGRPSFSSIPRSRTADGELGCCTEWKQRHRVCQSNCAPRRPPERRTNILNAVLCLIKELDYSNLEVVEMAVRCRMDELEG